jgi:hypothetical protein
MRKDCPCSVDEKGSEKKQRERYKSMITSRADENVTGQ